MKPCIHPFESEVVTNVNILRPLSTLFMILPILFLIPLLHVTPASAQGHDHYRGASTHAFPAESVSPIPSTAQLWSKIHSSHMALLRAVPGMSHNDVEYYLKALRGDLKALSKHPGDLNSQARASLDVTTKRLQDVAKTLKDAVKSDDTLSATAELAQLNDELDRIGQLFPASVLPKADGLKLAPPSADPAPRLTNAVEELRLSPLPQRALGVGSKAAPAQPKSADDRSDEACPMKPEAMGVSCACCGEAMEKTKD